MTAALLTPTPDHRGVATLAARRHAETLIEEAARRHGHGLVMSSSFGIHAAALLHLATRVVRKIPVVWVDTGYLPAETYRYAETLRERLDPSQHVYSAELSPARMEALYGRLWEANTPEALDRYHTIRKVVPMQRALDALDASGWLAGLRSDQTEHRGALRPIEEQWGREKFLPLLHWSTLEVERYLDEYDLPRHPLQSDGFATVGDWHTSRPLEAGDELARDSRFLGLKQECGLHLA